jgi:hypothetical protein
MRGPTQKEIMRARGFISASEVATLVGENITTVYRQLEDGRLRGMQIASRWYIEEKSLIEFIGPVAAKMLGIVESTA